MTGPTLTFDTASFDTGSSATFTADESARTITGMVVPWGQVARSGDHRWRFAPDSLKFTQLSRVKLLRDHDSRQAVGRAVKAWTTEAGQFATFSVARTPEGDAVLALAADGVVDGFSVGVDFAADGGWSPDPDDTEVRLVTSAAWRETSLCALPAFDDARVGAVAASTTERDLTMAATGTDPAPAPDTTALTTAVTESISAGFTSALERFANTPGREVIPAGRAVVTEAPLYRFDGGKGLRDFSTDLIAGSKGDREALGHVESFLAATFAVDTGDVTSLNPVRNRPDLYVDQLDYATPAWDLINKGTLSDQTPFVVPRFDGATNLVGPHTEGAEPTPGTFTATAQTITPRAVSGKVEVTREAWDAGGSPQLSSIIWRQMVRAYFEALEAAAVAQLDAATVTAIPIANGAADGDLDAALTGALAALAFTRGGNRFRAMLLSQDLFTGLVGAVDGDGRKLFPVLAPSNATGTTGPFFNTVAVGGLQGVPTWGLTGANSYVFAPEDVHGWASNPTRLEFQYRVAFVDVAIWGYVATAVTRADGIRRITYTA